MNEREPGPDHSISKENLVSSLPPALQYDSSKVALAESIAEVFAKRLEEIDRLRIFAVIDRLEEPLLSILANDFKVDWWDPNYSIEEKRRTLKSSWIVHKRLGTKYAVETALSAIYSDVTVLEWFEYGGEPYHFKLTINVSGIVGDLEKQRRVIERVNYYKNLRSHNDGVTYVVEAKDPDYIGIGGRLGIQACIGMAEEPNDYKHQDVVHVGGQFEIRSTFGISEKTNDYDFTGTIHAGGYLGGQALLSIEEDTALPPADSTLRAGGKLAARATLPLPEDTSPPPAQSELQTGGTLSVQSAAAIPENSEPPPSISIQRMGTVCNIISNLSQGE